MLKKSQRRISPSRAKEYEEVTAHKAPTEIVEIERNIIEQFLLKVRRKVTSGEIRVRAIIFGSAGVALLALALLITYLYRSQSHNEQFFTLTDQYEKASNLPAGDTQKGEFRRIAGEAEKLCNTFWSTRDSINACLLQAAVLVSAGEPRESANALTRFYNKYGAQYLGPFTLFYAAVAHESKGEFDQAEKLYRESEKILKAADHDDVAVYHQGRVLYLQGKYEEADTTFQRLIDSYEKSSYLDDARKYRLLIAAARMSQP